MHKRRCWPLIHENSLSLSHTHTHTHTQRERERERERERAAAVTTASSQQLSAQAGYQLSRFRVRGNFTPKLLINARANNGLRQVSDCPHSDQSTAAITNTPDKHTGLLPIQDVIPFRRLSFMLFRSIFHCRPNGVKGQLHNSTGIRFWTRRTNGSIPSQTRRRPFSKSDKHTRRWPPSITARCPPPIQDNMSCDAVMRCCIRPFMLPKNGASRRHNPYQAAISHVGREREGFTVFTAMFLN